MNKLLDFGRNALFYVRVLSGYEERRIRSFRLQLEKHVQQAQAKKAAINKVPEQIILSEVRHMVEEMQALNKKLEETETAIEEYFKPLDNQAEILMKMKLEGEEKSSTLMMEAVQELASLQNAKEEDEISTKMQPEGEEKTLKEMMKAMQQKLLTKEAGAESIPVPTSNPKIS